VICDVCGRENAEVLTYCQDCGHRLKAPVARVVPPTPPNGLPKVDVPPPPASPEPPARPSVPPRTRPEAPAFTFGPPIDAPVARTSTPPAAPRVSDAPPAGAKPAAHTAPPPLGAASSSSSGQRCPTCQADNPPLYRFCVACGTPLPGGAPAARSAARAPEREPLRTSALASTAAPTSPAPAAAAPAPALKTPVMADEKIVPTPVVDIASSRAAPPKLVACNRCQGQCAPGTRFCKFCGAPLEDAPQRGDRGASEPQPAAGAHASHSSGPPLPLVRPASAAVVTPTIPGARPAPAEAPLPAERRAPVTRPPEPLGKPQDTAISRAPAPHGRLVVIVEDGSEGRSYPFAPPHIDVGRSEGDVTLRDDPYVSPRHARIMAVGGEWVLRDLASTNGIFVRIRKRERLLDGDLLLLGLEVLQFQAVSNAERGLGHASQHGTLLFGSPATPRYARLCQRTVEGVTRDVHHLVRDETVIGREHGDIVFTGDPFLSRRHAVLSRDPATGDFSLADLDSSNGTYLAIREDVTLASGDYVRIGQHLFRVDLGHS
jgi:pSer/pThr/pTyr-binding forkhead associated (FHA) protein/predicted amidophosphoribosyltransferase